MPAILLWNIEHTSGYQDVFSSKNAFINEVIGHCIAKYDVTATILLEVTSEESVNQYAYNHSLNLTRFGEGTTLKYAILTKHAHTCTDVTAYFPSFDNKPRGVVHVASAIGSGMPPLLVTHIKSDQGMSGAACLEDMCSQLREAMHNSPPKWPRSGVTALADWNLKSEKASKVASLFGGRIVAPDQPTRYPKIPANKIMLPTDKAKTLDYACVFGTLRNNDALTAIVPDVFYYRGIPPLLDEYLRRVDETIGSYDQKLQQNVAALDAALSRGNLPLVRLNAITSDQERLGKEKGPFDLAREQIADLRERISGRKKMSDTDGQVFHQLITQAGMGPDHLPVVIQW